MRPSSAPLARRGPAAQSPARPPRPAQAAPTGPPELIWDVPSVPVIRRQPPGGISMLPCGVRRHPIANSPDGHSTGRAWSGRCDPAPGGTSGLVVAKATLQGRDRSAILDRIMLWGQLGQDRAAAPPVDRRPPGLGGDRSGPGRRAMQRYAGQAGVLLARPGRTDEPRRRGRRWRTGGRRTGRPRCRTARPCHGRVPGLGKGLASAVVGGIRFVQADLGDVCAD
jgi:hypothetical protein